MDASTNDWLISDNLRCEIKPFLPSFKELILIKIALSIREESSDFAAKGNTNALTAAKKYLAIVEMKGGT